MRGIPLLKRHLTDLKYITTTKTFNPSTGRFEIIETEEGFQGVLTHLSRDAINFLGHQAISSDDRELHTREVFKNNQIIVDGDKRYRVENQKEGEIYYGNYNVYVVKRAGDVK